MNLFSNHILTGSFILLAGLVAQLAPAADQPSQPVPFRVTPVLPDAAELLSPTDLHLGGFLGLRVLNNEKNRLLQVDLEPLLAGFRKKPGTHPWIGEHIGKWLHAATLAWANTGDPALRAKLDYAATELVKAQEADGYLGTYTPDKRFGLFPNADWDVWSHKYGLMGLLTYYQYTANESALAASRKIGDLLIRTFGPDKKSILSAGTHVGMAATSVLEPVILLYRHTGDARYLDFARYIVSSWEEPKGPRILTTLLTDKQVNHTANAKAYEMLSNLVGLCELARVTGNRDYVRAARNAWEDIVARRLYITGGASQGEHFHEDYHLPNQAGAAVSEGCVIATWIQLTSQLLRLTGEAPFGDQLERTFYNHLAAAQRPDGAQWCYFTPLEGTKPYGPGINCCVSSGPRGMALVPQHACLILRDSRGDSDSLAINGFDPFEGTAKIAGQQVRISLESDFPSKGSGLLQLELAKSARFGLRIRTPDWANPLELSMQDKPIECRCEAGWTIVPPRQWNEREQVRILFKIAPRLILGDHGNAGRAALAWGPFVLAYDEKLNPALPRASLLGFTDGDTAADCKLVQVLSSAVSAPKPGSAYVEDLSLQASIRSARLPKASARFVPFASAGASGGRYQVWLRAPGVEPPSNPSLFAGATESRSRQGNVAGSITDGDPESFVVTFDGTLQAQDQFRVALDEPVSIQRIVFVHGKNFHDGGWFDSSAGKPQVQVRRERNAPWETIAELLEYPATTASGPGALQDRASFSIILPRPEKALELRVAGKPACGDNPRQAFSSCAELQAFPDRAAAPAR